ncbi:hypothetical protein OG361_16610 [Streptomyces sp. NBC_00090]|uniref:hypothetical protein n=1 Tax=Streptomyces sp. NBC_00090 TaxID=2903619 RepID=UPI003253395E
MPRGTGTGTATSYSYGDGDGSGHRLELAEGADLLGELLNVSRVDILPFHKLDEAKWQALAKPFTLHDTPSPTPEQVTEVREVFLSHGLYAV